MINQEQNTSRRRRERSKTWMEWACAIAVSAPCFSQLVLVDYGQQKNSLTEAAYQLLTRQELLVGVHSSIVSSFSER